MKNLKIITVLLIGVLFLACSKEEVNPITQIEHLTPTPTSTSDSLLYSLKVDSGLYYTVGQQDTSLIIADICTSINYTIYNGVLIQNNTSSGDYNFLNIINNSDTMYWINDCTQDAILRTYSIVNDTIIFNT